MPTAPRGPARDAAAQSDHEASHSDRIAALQRQIADLREAVASHELIGIATGMLVQRFDRSPEQAWQLLVHLSQLTNVKVRVVAQTLLDAQCGRLRQDAGELPGVLEHLLVGRVADPATRG